MANAPQGPAPGRLLKRGDFLAAAKGRRASTALLTLQARPRPDATEAAPRIGLTVTKKTGGAVERNRMRRRLRQAVRQIAPMAAQPGHDYVIVARQDVLGANFDTLLADLESAFRRVHAASSDKGRKDAAKGQS
ncbi:ribonuclease P protein component [Terrihabitans soli]|uniref:Ribonuclease P protein component n=1 Tax=Terrihabitans soli TaxID=708113 RepID=A0A6S6QQZ1_9HYPH|nr:ribonuclease P protein component [Terrihabitans soli]BCJ91996.1 ribonuclease P protein component [Terrihabitans soli]